jgi:acyl carrier protein
MDRERTDRVGFGEWQGWRLILVNATAHRLNQTPYMPVASNRIEGHVLAVVAQKFNATIQDVTPRTNLRRDLGADSLAMVEFVMMLEAEFQVDIPDEDVEEIVTVRQVIDYLKDETHMVRP